MSAQIAPTPIVHGPEAEKKSMRKQIVSLPRDQGTVQRNWQAFLTR